MSGDARVGELALSWGVQGDDTPRLIIPLVPIGSAAAESAQQPGSADPATGAATHTTPPVPPVPPVVAAWARLAATAADVVVVLDLAGRVVSLSPPAAELIARPAGDIAGRHLLDVLALVDFNPTPGDASMYADRIPPLLAIASNTLSRGLLRLRTAGRTVTLDAVAAPLHDAGGTLVGAIAFLARLGS